MLLFPNAKINLGLSILNKRKDGFHNLESIFLPIPLCDSLEFIEAEKFSFESSLKLDNEKPNSITKSIDLLSKKYNLPPLSVYLQKNIPIGAGIGGGSADGAFMIKGLNDYFKLNISTKELENLALQIGADCPFFIKNKPKFVSGIGEILEDITIDLKGYNLVIINPNIHIRTKEAFENFELNSIKRRNLKDIIQNEKIENWKQFIFNDFERNIFKNHPEIKSIKDKLYEKGAIYSSMTGTGSTVYAFFENKIDLSIFDSNYFKRQFILD